ncbi:hypothetical protein Pcinc_039948 [Petrolisthes cinctipes]|uniref:Uncharacterized protein n=1 Tax=Petrolisthes cinctipes TaxID=88211 RepID=A0AAE1BMM8_PETCI|nr:hypothetical protein Pcinc_039948 [Petrolisthes cinctipes]
MQSHTKFRLVKSPYTLITLHSANPRYTLPLCQPTLQPITLHSANPRYTLSRYTLSTHATPYHVTLCQPTLHPTTVNPSQSTPTYAVVVKCIVHIKDSWHHNLL